MANSPDKSNRHDEFIELITRHHSQLYGYIFAVLRNDDEAEELHQQTILALWRKFGDFQPGTDFSRWAIRVTRFELLRFMRLKSRNPSPIDGILLSEITATDSFREDHWRTESRRLALSHCMERLSDSDRRLLEDCYQQNSSIRQVAKAIGRPAQSVYNSLSRIRTSLFFCITRTLRLEEEA